MKIVVTGGAGFIGSNLCEALLGQGHSVTCFDNFSTGKMKNIRPFLNNANFNLNYGDIRNQGDCRKACHGAEYVLHQAGVGSVPRSINDPITTNEVNVTGFLNMLIAAREAKIKRFIYASSSSIYGDSTLSPKVEEHIGSPLSPYAASKYANELYAAAFSNSYGLNCIGLRYFNVFGERQDSDGDYAAVIPTFIKKLFLHESPVINGNGEQTRDFTYVKDVVRINLLALSAQKPESLNTVYNVACGNQTSLNELVVYLKNCLTSYDPGVAEIEAIYGPNRVGDVLQSLAGIRKAEKRLGYHPQYDVQQGLAATVRWFWMDQDSK